jgi:hypothetical protein
MSSIDISAPVKGATDITRVLKAWNTESAGAGAAEAAAAPPAPAAEPAVAAPAAAAAAPVSTPSGNIAAARAAAAAKTEAEAAERAAEVEADVHRFSALDAEFRSQEWFKNKVKRTGWSKPIPGYTPATCNFPCGKSIPGCSTQPQVLCGNSWEDMGYIILCFIALYCSIALYFYALLEFNKATDEGHFALYLFVGLLVMFWAGLLTLARSGPAHNEELLEADEEEGGHAAADASVAETTQPLTA